MRNVRSHLLMLFLLLIVVHIPADGNAQIICGVHYHGTVAQEYYAWCGFACMQILSQELQCLPVDQCDYVNEACALFEKGDLMPPEACGECCGLNMIQCSQYFLYTYETDDFMRYMGFRDVNGPLVQWRYPAVSADEYINEICGWNYLLVAYDKDKINPGHGVVVLQYDTYREKFGVLNPAPGDKVWATFDELQTGTFTNGPVRQMYEYMRVGDCDQWVGIEDVGGFWYNSQDNIEMKFEYRLAYTADPDDSVAVYVCDNPWGPARLIQALVEKPLSEPPPSEGTVCHFETGAYPYKSNYYYFLDFDTGPFETIRPLIELYPSEDNPTYWTANDWPGWEDRPVFDTPSNLSVSDVPLDLGRALEISWALSANDSEIDQYNIYREKLTGGFEFIASVPPGTSSYVDQDADGSNTYVVSTAHQGGNPSQSQMYGTIGIWNDFSAEVTGEAIHNYYFSCLSVISNDTLIVCPAGDGDTLKVEFTVLGSDSSPTLGIPADSLVLYATHLDTTVFCAGDTICAIRDSDENGKTEFQIPYVGGGGTVKLVGHIKGTYLFTDTISVLFTSPDIRILDLSEGNVDIVDYATFAEHYESPPEPYSPGSDFNLDGCIDIIDFAYFATHYLHYYDAGSGNAPRQVNVAYSVGSVRLGFTEDYPLQGDRTLKVSVDIHDAEPYKVIVLSFKNENPIFRFLRWVQDDDYLGTTMCADIERNGSNEIFLGALAGKSRQGSDSKLGYFEVAVNSTEPLILTDSDFEIVVADLLETDGGTRIFESSQTTRSVEPIHFVNQLRQNYPNPFNPTTTIAFSIRNDADVELLIYDVRGALVKTLVDDNRKPNNYKVTWDGKDNRGQSVASGVYFYRLIAGDFKATKKMVLLR